MAAEEDGEEPKQVEQEGDHRAEIVSGSGLTDQPLAGGRGFGEGQLAEILHQPFVRRVFDRDRRVKNPLEHKGVQVGSALRAPLPGQSSPGLDWPLTS